LRPIIFFVPFSLKAMLFPALVASDKNLRELGWQPKKTLAGSLKEVVSREKSRTDLQIPPIGQTVITGAASGLGRALVHKLANYRYRLLLIDIDSIGLAELTLKYSNCTSKVIDLSKKGEVNCLMQTSDWKDNTISELYLCAGIGLRGNIHDLPTNDIVRMFEINVISRIVLAKNIINSMLKQHLGRIVFISSSSAFQPLPYMAAYAATNSALLSLAEAWSEEVGQQGVQVMSVCPGGMQTNFQSKAGVREVKGEKLMTPEEVADQIINGLQNQRMTLIVSFRSFAMSLLARFLPRRSSVRLWSYLMEKMR